MAKRPVIESRHRPASDREPSAFLVSLSAPGKGATGRRLPLGMWSSAVPGAGDSLDEVREQSGELGIEIASDHLVVPTGAACRMRPELADALGLPPLYEGIITLRAVHPARDVNHAVVAEIGTVGGLDVPTRTGAYLVTRKGGSLLQQRIASLLDKLAVLSARPPSAERRDAYIEAVCNALGDETYGLAAGGTLCLVQGNRLEVFYKPTDDGALVPDPRIVTASGEGVVDPIREKDFVAAVDDCSFGTVPVFPYGRWRMVLSPYAVEALGTIADERAHPTMAFPGPADEGQPGFGAHVEGYVPWTGLRLPFLRKQRPTRIPDAFFAEVRGRTVLLTPIQAARIRGEVGAALASGQATLPIGDEDFTVADADRIAAGVESQVAGLRDRIEQRDADFPGKVDIRRDDAVAIGPTGTGPAAADRTAALMQLKCRTNYLAVEHALQVKPRELHLLNGPPGDLVEGFLYGTRIAPHQREGVEWAARHYAEGTPGVILCDEPGLGKTLTGLLVAAWISAAAASDLPVLVVVPPDAHDIWPNEATRHLIQKALGSPYVATSPSIGGKGGPGSGDMGRMRGKKWVVTTYTTLRDHHVMFSQVRWAAVILDEAHLLKNPTTRMRNAIFALRADFRLLLTGTPVENSIEDIWSLMDIAWPGFLGSLRDFVRVAYQGDKVNPDFVQELSGRLMRPEFGSPAILGRRKEDRLVGLPAKQRHMLKAQMPPEQAALYGRVLDEHVRGRSGSGGGFAAMWDLSLASLHPDALAKPRFDYSHKEARAWMARSARTELAYEALLPAMEAGEKAIVVVNVKGSHPILAAMFKASFGLPNMPVWLNGDVGVRERASRIKRFRETPGAAVMLITHRVGGLGHTFTEARHVTHLNRWPTPASETQVEDRTHRMGQVGGVQVYVPQAVYGPAPEASIDLWMERLHQEKRVLAQDLLMPGRDFDYTDDLVAEMRRAA